MPVEKGILSKEDFLKMVEVVDLEVGKMAPNNQLASKLEHMLKIKLLVPISEEKVAQIPRSANQELTLGDIIELDKDEEAASKRKPS